MGEIIGFSGGSLFVLFSLSILFFALSELKIIKGNAALINGSILYTYGIMASCLAIGFIFYAVAKKNINTDLLNAIFGNVNGNMNTLTSNFSIASLKTSGFMPLYPILIHLLGKLCFGQFEFVAMMLSAVCMSLSVYYFNLTYGSKGLFLPLFPLAFTGFMASPDSMALLFSIMILYAIKKDKLVLCFILCILLVFTDIRGIFIVFPIYLLSGNTKKLWVIMGAFIPFVFLYIFYDAMPKAELTHAWFPLICVIVLMLCKNKKYTAELAYGMLLIAAGYLFPFARVNLLLALPVAVALQTIENTYFKYLAIFTSCVLLAYMIVSAI